MRKRIGWTQQIPAAEWRMTAPKLARGKVPTPRDGRGSFHPLKRRRQWLDSASSMVGDASVNGLSSATQWMERCDSMDGTSHFNGLTIACPSTASSLPTFREKWEIWQGQNAGQERLDAADSGGGMAELERWAGRDGV